MTITDQQLLERLGAELYYDHIIHHDHGIGYIGPRASLELLRKLYIDTDGAWNYAYQVWCNRTLNDFRPLAVQTLTSDDHPAIVQHLQALSHHMLRNIALEWEIAEGDNFPLTPQESQTAMRVVLEDLVFGFALERPIVLAIGRLWLCPNGCHTVKI